MHQPAHRLGGGRHRDDAERDVDRLARREVVRHRADAAQPLHHHGHFPVRAALDELLEAAEFHDVQPDLVDAVLVVEEQRHLAVALDPGHRVDRHAPEPFRVLCGLELEGHG